MDRRLRAHAHDIRVALPILDYFGEHFPDEESARYNDLEAELGVAFAEMGRDLAERLESGRDLTSASCVTGSVQPRPLIHYAKILWPDYVDGYIETLDSKADKRLIRSM